MGVLWSVFPLDHRVRQWLDELEVPYPDKPSRYPTGAEVKAVLRSLNSYKVEITERGVGRDWNASINWAADAGKGPWASLRIIEYSGDDLPQEIWFSGGWSEPMTEILRGLSVTCGPLILVPTTGELPEVITA